MATPQHANVPQEEQALLLVLRRSNNKKARIEVSDKHVINFPPALPIVLFQPVVDVVHRYGCPFFHTFSRIVLAKDQQNAEVFRKKSNTQSATYNNSNSSFIANIAFVLEVISINIVLCIFFLVLSLIYCH